MSHVVLCIGFGVFAGKDLASGLLLLEYQVDLIDVDPLLSGIADTYVNEFKYRGKSLRQVF